MNKVKDLRDLQIAVELSDGGMNLAGNYSWLIMADRLGVEWENGTVSLPEVFHAFLSRIEAMEEAFDINRKGG